MNKLLFIITSYLCLAFVMGCNDVRAPIHESEGEVAVGDVDQAKWPTGQIVRYVVTDLRVLNPCISIVFRDEARALINECAECALTSDAYAALDLSVDDYGIRSIQCTAQRMAATAEVNAWDMACAPYEFNAYVGSNTGVSPGSAPAVGQVLVLHRTATGYIENERVVTSPAEPYMGAGVFNRCVYRLPMAAEYSASAVF